MSKKWSASETRLLIEFVTIKNMSWVNIASKLPGRTIESCRSRFYIIQRAPKRKYGLPTKKIWTDKETTTLVNLRIENNTWEQISRKLGRSTDECVQQIKTILCRPKRRLENEILDDLIHIF